MQGIRGTICWLRTRSTFQDSFVDAHNANRIDSLLYIGYILEINGRKLRQSYKGANELLVSIIRYISGDSSREPVERKQFTEMFSAIRRQNEIRSNIIQTLLQTVKDYTEDVESVLAIRCEKSTAEVVIPATNKCSTDTVRIDRQIQEALTDEECHRNECRTAS